jgi:hypothetical protein
MRILPEQATISPERLPEAAQELRVGGWRFITASCLRRPQGWTVLYHFERDERLRHLRLEVGAGGSVPAIDAAYPAAFLIENEMGELQGLPVTGLSIDYQGRLFRDFDALEGAAHPDPAACPAIPAGMADGRDA